MFSIVIFNLKIKFMKSKTDTAMAQMGSVRQVYTTIDNLHGALLFGNKLALRPSKQQILHEIRDPFILPDGTPSYRYRIFRVFGEIHCVTYLFFSYLN